MTNHSEARIRGGVDRNRKYYRLLVTSARNQTSSCSLLSHLVSPELGETCLVQVVGPAPTSFWGDQRYQAKPSAFPKHHLTPFLVPFAPVFHLCKLLVDEFHLLLLIHRL